MDASYVREFTRESGQEVPERPRVASKEQAMFLAKMMLDELMEFTATVAGPAESKSRIKAFVAESRDLAMVEGDACKVVAEQVDALVDCYYYSLNACAKKGINLSALFAVVHAANMAKRDPVTGKFIKRDDGKIIKPAGWQPPDVEGEIARQIELGAFPPAAAAGSGSGSGSACGSGCGSGSDAELVREFTAGAGQPTPARPSAFSEAEVFFLTKMMLDEIMEYLATVAPPEEAKAALAGFADASKDIPQTQFESSAAGEAQRIADQADALVDSYYYSLNSSCRHGCNVSAVFAVVHAANMAKRDPATGQFLKREDGKIIKPAGWQPPDVEAEMARQMLHGAFEMAGPGPKQTAGGAAATTLDKGGLAPAAETAGTAAPIA